MRTVNRLSPLEVANARPPSGKKRVRILDGQNLYLVATISKSGGVNKWWEFQYEIAGDRHWLGLGPVSDLTLAEARERARAYRQMIRDGVDPLQDRREKRRALIVARTKQATFKEDAEKFMALHERGWSTKHATQWRASVRRYVFPHLANTPVREIVPATLLRIFEPLWLKHTVTISRVINRVENILDYSIAHDHRESPNPASGLLAALPKRSKVTTIEHFAAVPYEAVPDVMARLREIETRAAIALRFLILCTSRAGEILACEWSEIDLKAKVWSIPGAKMKRRRRHRIPLTSAALEVLEALPRHGKRVFVIGPEGMRYVLRKVAPGSTVHGFRTAFRQWAAERTSFPRAAIELSLAHAVALDQTEDSYLRDADLLEKRRKLMELWAKFCTSPPVAAGAKVTPMRKAGAGA